MINLTEKREKAGLTQEQLAAKMNISRQAVSMLESGKNTPKVSTAKKLGEILHFDWTELYEQINS